MTGEQELPPAIRIEAYGPVSVARQHQNRHLREFCRDLGARRILNVGAYPGGRDKEGSTYDAYFPGAHFETTDRGPHADPRHTEDDITMPQRLTGPYDLILAMSVLEHVERPWFAAGHITRLMNSGGHLYIAMPFFYPVHEGVGFGDHWRWTPSATRILFPELTEVSCALWPSVITSVRDRANYWSDPSNSYTGFSMLMRKA